MLKPPSGFHSEGTSLSGDPQAGWWLAWGAVSSRQLMLLFVWKGRSAACHKLITMCFAAADFWVLKFICQACSFSISTCLIFICRGPFLLFWNSVPVSRALPLFFNLPLSSPHTTGSFNLIPPTPHNSVPACPLQQPAVARTHKRKKIMFHRVFRPSLLKYYTPTPFFLLKLN